MKILKGRTRQSGQWIPQSIHLRFHGAKGSSRWELRRLEAGTQPFGPRGERYQTKLVQRSESETVRIPGRDRLLHTWLFTARRTSTFRGELYAFSCTPADNRLRIWKSPLSCAGAAAARTGLAARRGWGIRGSAAARAAQPDGARSAALHCSRDIVNFEKSVSWREPAWCQHRLEGRILYMLGVSSKPPGPRQAARTQAQTRTQDRQAAVCGRPASKSCRTRSSRRTLEPNTQTGVRSLYFA